MLQKIYVHHYYSKSLFYKIAHNTTDRNYNLKENIGSVFCKYKDNSIEFVFQPEINDNTDGYHFIDFLTILSQINIDKKLSLIDCVNKKRGENSHRGKWGAEFGINDIPIMKWIADTLQNRKDWIVSLLRTEKSFIQYDMPGYWQIMDLENQINRLKNHHLLTDNFFINQTIENKYPNHSFVLTNTIHQWNELLSIRWYYEFANVYSKLNPPYDLCFSMRYHKKNRTNIITKLAELNNDKIFLSRTNNCKNKEFYLEETRFKNYNNINLNNWEGEDFDDISWIENIEHYLDYLMRILPMAKMHILSETWDWFNGEITSNYLSEKTYGLVLANVPFISTHTYPLDILQNMLNLEKHPFYENIKKCIGNEINFVKFIDTFLKDYEINYKKCFNWHTECRTRLLEKINTENSMLEKIFSKMKKNQYISKKQSIL